jgi:PAS domain S-box-containing protein
MSPQQIRHHDASLHHLIKLYNKNVLSGVFGVIAGASLIAFFYATNLNSELIYYWYSGLLFMALTRYVVYKKYITHTFTDREYLVAIYLCVLVTGIGWALIPFLFLDVTNSTEMLFTLFALGGISAGAIATMTGFNLLGFLYISITLLPAISHFINSTSTLAIEISIGMVLYYLFILITYFKISNSARDNIQSSIKSSHNEKIVRQLINSSVDGIISLDKNGRVLDWNKMAENLFDCSRENALHSDIQSLISLGPGCKLFHDLENFTDSAKQRRELVEYKKPGGKNLTLEFILQPVSTSEDLFFSLNIHDISLQMEKDRVITEAEARARNLLNLVDTGIIELTLDGSISFINDTALNITGYKHEELIEQNFHSRQSSP